MESTQVWEVPRPLAAAQPDRLSRYIDPARLQRLAAVAEGTGEARERITVRAPFTGEPLGAVPRGTADDVQRAVARARGAQAEWAARSLAERRRVLLSFHDLLLTRREEVLDLVQLESGKARRHALEEVLDTAGVARYYSVRGERLLRPRRRRGALPGLTTAWERLHPVGVVGIIAPWNYPLTLAVTDALPALMAGNAVVLKPDQQTPFTALWAAQLLREAGLPPGALAVVTGEGPVLGPSLVSQVDFVMFTGSTRTGRVVAAQAAERIVGCSLELGGKNPMLVLADADLERAVEGAVRGCFVGAGQACVSIERIYVHASLFDRFAARLAERAARLRLGGTLEFDVDMGSLVSERQLATVSEHVTDALARGAILLAGGRARPDLGPFFFEPTVLTDVTPAMRLFAEETFGPVVALYPFESEAEAVASANATRYGLSASVWSRSRRRAVRVAARLRAGSVNVNEAYAAAWGSVDAPIGGMKESGLGRRHGAQGLLKFTEPQTIAGQRWLPLAPPPGLEPARYASLMCGLLRLLRRLPGLR